MTSSITVGHSRHGGHAQRYAVGAFPGLRARRLLLTSPFQFVLFDTTAAGTVRDISRERSLRDPAFRNALTGWSGIVCGLLLMLFGTLALSPRFAWAQWGTTVVGLWLLFAPLLFWTPSGAACMNDTIVGAIAIAHSVLVPMMPGMSREGMMDESTVPPGWTYSPSSLLNGCRSLRSASLAFRSLAISRLIRWGISESFGSRSSPAMRPGTH